MLSGFVKLTLTRFNDGEICGVPLSMAAFTENGTFI